MPPPKHDRSLDMRRSVSLSSKEHGFSFGIPRSQLQYFPLDPTARKIKLGDNVDFNAIARAASGASGAELANMVNEAALRAVRENRKFVVQSH